ncbi:pyruvate ferredoxin oxidoreductase [Roseospirillum parvum]|uniref:Pyruvate ferredoxin oxidoreductase alpha subunit n=1 Tax=Roseospirillum parvum TaxID=83401 RepID=A0A1G7XJF6_9PROT|nr:pyruvate ferredoxin oxidoreductase [Roseospirillum parvum]SDG84297.1 pyruvate ferredoxin oxidoreductase alpha subunit [Roseospirillum parvum]
MLKALEGSQALARAVALCRPGVVAAYPITPQTHIVENISKLVADGEMGCELVSVESEFSAASVVLGAAAAGARAYTASSSQGIMLMSEVLYNMAGLRIPAVITCANRSVGAPLNIWNDQADSMAIRDSGCIQLYCADNQEGVDSTIQAFRIAEATELPVMVCVDGFVLTHTLEPIDLPSQTKVDRFLPEFDFARRLDPKAPKSFGTLVDPGWFTEVRHSHHRAMQKALPVIEEIDAAYEKAIGRAAGGLLKTHGPKGAKTAVLALGSVVSTLRQGLNDGLAKTPVKIIQLRCFRPFPTEALIEAVDGVDDLIVLERAFSPGLGGIVGTEVTAALAHLKKRPRIHNFAVGLGGRDVPVELLPELIAATRGTTPEPFRIFDVELDKLPAEDR